jgi:hypothetical protein
MTEIFDWRRSVDIDTATQAVTPGTSPWEAALGAEPEGFGKLRYRRVKAAICDVRRDIGLESQQTARAVGDLSPPMSGIEAVEAAPLARNSGFIDDYELPGPAPPGLEDRLDL